MATLRELKGRIGSVASSEKITGAMKMISSAKMHKAEQSLRRLLPFRNQIENIIGNLLSADAEFSSPLLEIREVKTVTVVVFGSDDGLCGAYNVNIFKRLLGVIAEYREKYGQDVTIRICPVGNKMRKAVCKIIGGNVSLKSADGVDSKTSGDSVRVFIEDLQTEFLNGITDKVDVLYMSFKSMSRQSLAIDQLLPIVQDSFTTANQKLTCKPYLFEPNANTIFCSVLPMYLMAMMQDVFTENRASEQAARVMAMQSANDNAKKLLEQLQLEYNKLRQQSITTELLDILGGQIK